MILVIAAVAVYLIAFSASAAIPFRWAYLLCCAIALVPQIIYAYLFPIYQYRRHRYLIAEDRVEIIEGIIIRTHTVIPILRIQHVVVSSGPINQLMRLADVAIHTASGIHRIPELDRDEAERLCTLLKERVNQRLKAALLTGEESAHLPEKG